MMNRYLKTNTKLLKQAIHFVKLVKDNNDFNWFKIMKY